jgi:hypothetical protein
MVKIYAQEYVISDPKIRHALFILHRLGASVLPPGMNPEYPFRRPSTGLEGVAKRIIPEKKINVHSSVFCPVLSVLMLKAHANKALGGWRT